MSEQRLMEIVNLALKLGWVIEPKYAAIPVSYPLMQLSEVEKCMLAMVDDFELERMRKWVGEKAQATTSRSAPRGKQEDSPK